MTARLFFVLVLAAQGAWAQTLSFPSNASLTREVAAAGGSYAMPVGVWDGLQVPMQPFEGQVTQQAWRINAPALTTLQVLRPLREQLRNDRFDIIFECDTQACGGFDFRFAMQTLPPPEMQINLGDFRFLAAQKDGSAGPEMLSLLVSRTAQAGFVQIIHVGPDTPRDSPIVKQQAATAAPSQPLSVTALDQQFGQIGRAVLNGLTFETGSAQLGTGDFPVLNALADYLRTYPDRRVTLVGHTDASGDLETNIALSKRRAGSVIARLISDFDIPRAQLSAEGMGYLSPLATNLTAQGREVNRRVEVIVLPDPD